MSLSNLVNIDLPYQRTYSLTTIKYEYEYFDVCGLFILTMACLEW